jgi:phosphate-selective porin OprO and OprP
LAKFLVVAFSLTCSKGLHGQEADLAPRAGDGIAAWEIPFAPQVDEARELAQLKERIATLERRFEKELDGKEFDLPSPGQGSQGVVGAVGKPSSPKDSPAAAKKKDGWEVRFGGHVQMDYVTWADAAPSIPDTFDYFNFRRLRILADGKGYENYDFRLQMTLEPDNTGDNPSNGVLTPLVKDAYFSLNEIPWLGRFRIGNFFVPFGLEQVTNDTNNIFLERSIPTQGIFTPDREVGIAFYNRIPSERLAWATGVFIDSISEGLKLRQDDNQGYRVSGRVTWLPYYDEPSQGRYLVHTGLGVLYTDDQNNSVRIRARPQVSEGPRIIDTGALAADDYTIGNFEAAVVWERFTVQSEAFLSRLNMLNGDGMNANGAYIHMSWFVTGESRMYERFGQHGPQFGRNVPFTNFAFSKSKRGPGALELKTRWSHLDLNQLQAGQYNDLTVGFNWYWSDRTRIMFDWIRPVTSSTAIFGATSSDLIATRFDFNW